MYLYFDKTGALKEIINDEALRQGNYFINYLCVYIEGRDYESLDIAYTLPSGAFVGPMNYKKETNAQTLQIPFNPKRDLKFFKYYTDYEFVVIPLEADLNGNAPLDEAGTVHTDITAMLLDDTQLVLGEVNFTVERNTTLNLKQIASQEYMSLSDYQFLRRMIGNFVGVAPQVTYSTETLPEGQDAVVTVISSETELHWSLAFDFKIPGGVKGDQGDPGTPAGFGSVTASSETEVPVAGQPDVEVSVSTSGPDAAKDFSFGFKFKIPEAVISTSAGMVAFSVNPDGQLIAHTPEESGTISGLAIDENGQLVYTY